MDKRLIICINRRLNPGTPSCAASGSEQIASQLEDRFRILDIQLEIERVHCLGQCERGPNLRFAPSGNFLHGVSLEDLDSVIKQAQAFVERK